MKQSRIKVFSGLDPKQYMTQAMWEQMDMHACLTILEQTLHPHGLHCMECGSSSRRGAGKTAKGVPRYKCMDCGITYTVLSYTPFSGTTLCPRRIVLFMWLSGLGCGTQETAEIMGLTRQSVTMLQRKIKFYASMQHQEM